MPITAENMNHVNIESVVANGISHDNDIVITGISGNYRQHKTTETDCYENVMYYLLGRFPESSNMEEFKENLMKGVDMITEDDRRWPLGIYGLPLGTGKLKDITSFDASFFGIHPKQADMMDPQLRMMLETTFEAIVDAGINPVTIRGSKTGVFIGASTSESEGYWARSSDVAHGWYNSKTAFN